MKPTFLNDLFLAYFEARRHKRLSPGGIAFEMNYEWELMRLRDEIVSGTYEVSPSICFVSTFPVRREIFAGDFRDRVVHHLVFNYLNPFCERLFINDSYSCRKGRGTSFGISRADHFARSVSENYTREAYVLKLDISGYFMSIDKSILLQKIQNILKRFRTELPFDERMFFRLVEKIVWNDPTKNCIIKGKKEDWVGMPKSKSLFFSKEGCGLPIGNLTSQLFSNVYLHDLDMFALKNLHIRRYGRYVDDMIFFSRDKAFLSEVPRKVEAYLQEDLHIKLHPKKIYFQPVERGFLFLGRMILPYRRYLKRKTKANAYKKMLFWGEVLRRQGGVLDNLQQQSFDACLRSYHGIFISCKGRRLERKIFSLVNPSVPLS